MASCTTTPVETREWLDSLKAVLRFQGPGRANYLLEKLSDEAGRSGSQLPFTATTPYVKTILAEKEEKSPGNREIEHEIRSAIRWNAVAIILRAKRVPASIREITIGRIRNTKQRRLIERLLGEISVLLLSRVARQASRFDAINPASRSCERLREESNVRAKKRAHKARCERQRECDHGGATEVGREG